MINHDRGWVFLHPPKTGGTSIESVLRGAPRAAHFTHKQYKQRIEGKPYFFFATVRNPFARVVSEYFWSTNTAHKWPDPEYKKFFKGLSFKEFVHKFYSLEYKDVAWCMTKFFFEHHHKAHRMSQAEFLRPASEVNLIIKCEELQAGFDKVCAAIGRPKVKLPCRNKTKHDHYSTYYDPELVDFVSNLYKEDLETFDYSFEGKLTVS